MELTNLSTHPEYFNDAIALIERAFGYEAGQSFEVDFYPLMSPRNRKNCWILVEKGEIVAHTGLLEKTISLKNDFPIAFIGGVAVKESHRGRGLATKLLKSILKEHASKTLFVLWSEKMDFYRKFDFYPCVELYSYPQITGPSSFKKISPNNKEWKEIQNLYNASNEIRVERNFEDWEEIKKITSAEIYVKRTNGNIENYFIKNKGMDLKGVIHEYGCLNDQDEIMASGNLWASNGGESATPLFGSLVRIGNEASFKSFVSEFTDGSFLVQNIKDNINFSFAQENFSLNQEEFLQGLFGPGRIQELGEIPKLFISGLDSI